MVGLPLQMAGSMAMRFVGSSVTSVNIARSQTRKKPFAMINNLICAFVIIRPPANHICFQKKDSDDVHYQNTVRTGSRIE